VPGQRLVELSNVDDGAIDSTAKRIPNILALVAGLPEPAPFPNGACDGIHHLGHFILDRLNAFVRTDLLSFCLLICCARQCPLQR